MSRYATDRAIMAQAWAERHGDAPPFAVALAHAVSELETNCGRGWKEEQSYGGVVRACPGATSSNNWGAVQATGGQPSFACWDTHQDGRLYSQAFRAYPSPLDGARDALRHLSAPLRPLSEAALRRGDLEGLALAMYRERYFGASCPRAIARFGPIAAHDSTYGRRVRKTTAPQTEAGEACDAEAVAQYAGRLRKVSDQLQDALGQERVPLHVTGDGGLGLVLALVVVAGSALVAVKAPQLAAWWERWRSQ